jgi:hypothetical protein
MGRNGFLRPVHHLLHLHLKSQQGCDTSASAHSGAGLRYRIRIEDQLELLFSIY